MSEELTTMTEITDNTQDYIDTINQLKATTVSRDDYDRIVSENKKLLNSLSRGQSPEVAKPVEKKDIRKMRDELVYGNHSNLEYVERALELRNEMIAQGKEDPFLPQGRQIAATSDDIAAANRVAEALAHCVEYAAGDSLLFTNELQRITRDVTPMAARHR